MSFGINFGGEREANVECVGIVLHGSDNDHDSGIWFSIVVDIEVFLSPLLIHPFIKASPYLLRIHLNRKCGFGLE